MKKIVITTGDVDGIGFEITAKALEKIKLKKNIQLLVWHSSHVQKKYLRFFRKHRADLYTSFDDALKSKSAIVEIVSEKNPALWFQESVKHWKKFDAIVTGPLSKLTVEKAGLKDGGHTDILRRIVKPKKPIVMSFMGTRFSLLLLTDHIAYKDVPRSINKRVVLESIFAANTFLKMQNRKGKIGVLGLNPHAGEIKKLGTEEKKYIAPAIRAAQARGLNVVGPLIPDITFQPQNIKKCAVYIAMYHDQGLIPFKIHHKNEKGIQVAVNLPFIRTSVDHGTAKDIFGKDKANYSSMLMAIQKAMEWC